MRENMYLPFLGTFRGQKPRFEDELKTMLPRHMATFLKNSQILTQKLNSEKSLEELLIFMKNELTGREDSKIQPEDIYYFADLFVTNGSEAEARCIISFLDSHLKLFSEPRLVGWLIGYLAELRAASKDKKQSSKLSETIEIIYKETGHSKATIDVSLFFSHKIEQIVYGRVDGRAKFSTFHCDSYLELIYDYKRMEVYYEKSSQLFEQLLNDLEITDYELCKVVCELCDYHNCSIPVIIRKLRAFLYLQIHFHSRMDVEDQSLFKKTFYWNLEHEILPLLLDKSFFFLKPVYHICFDVLEKSKDRQIESAIAIYTQAASFLIQESPVLDHDQKLLYIETQVRKVYDRCINSSSFPAYLPFSNQKITQMVQIEKNSQYNFFKNSTDLTQSVELPSRPPKSKKSMEKCISKLKKGCSNLEKQIKSYIQCFKYPHLFLLVEYSKEKYDEQRKEINEALDDDIRPEKEAFLKHFYAKLLFQCLAYVCSQRSEEYFQHKSSFKSLFIGRIKDQLEELSVDDLNFTEMEISHEADWDEMQLLKFNITSNDLDLKKLIGYYKQNCAYRCKGLLSLQVLLIEQEAFGHQMKEQKNIRQNARHYQSQSQFQLRRKSAFYDFCNTMLEFVLRRSKSSELQQKNLKFLRKLVDLLDRFGEWKLLVQISMVLVCSAEQVSVSSAELMPFLALLFDHLFSQSADDHMFDRQTLLMVLKMDETLHKLSVKMSLFFRSSEEAPLQKSKFSPQDKDQSEQLSNRVFNLFVRFQNTAEQTFRYGLSFMRQGLFRQAVFIFEYLLKNFGNYRTLQSALQNRQLDNGRHELISKVRLHLFVCYRRIDPTFRKMEKHIIRALGEEENFGANLEAISSEYDSGELFQGTCCIEEIHQAIRDEDFDRRDITDRINLTVASAMKTLLSTNRNSNDWNQKYCLFRTCTLLREVDCHVKETISMPTDRFQKALNSLEALSEKIQDRSERAEIVKFLLTRVYDENGSIIPKYLINYLDFIVDNSDEKAKNAFIETMYGERKLNQEVIVLYLQHTWHFKHSDYKESIFYSSQLRKQLQKKDKARESANGQSQRSNNQAIKAAINLFQIYCNEIIAKIACMEELTFSSIDRMMRNILQIYQSQRCYQISQEKSSSLESLGSQNGSVQSSEFDHQVLFKIMRVIFEKIRIDVTDFNNVMAIIQKFHSKIIAGGTNKTKSKFLYYILRIFFEKCQLLKQNISPILQSYETYSENFKIGQQNISYLISQVRFEDTQQTLGVENTVIAELVIAHISKQPQYGSWWLTFLKNYTVNQESLPTNKTQPPPKKFEVVTGDINSKNDYVIAKIYQEVQKKLPKAKLNYCQWLNSLLRFIIELRNIRIPFNEQYKSRMLDVLNKALKKLPQRIPLIFDPNFLIIRLITAKQIGSGKSNPLMVTFLCVHKHYSPSVRDDQDRFSEKVTEKRVIFKYNESKNIVYSREADSSNFYKALQILDDRSTYGIFNITKNVLMLEYIEGFNQTLRRFSLENTHNQQVLNRFNMLGRRSNREIMEKVHGLRQFESSFFPLFYDRKLSSSTGIEGWWQKLNNFIKTLAYWSYLGFITGLGDRHSENIMISEDGRITHIDLEYNFGYGMNLQYPEWVPFRLTKPLEQALGFFGKYGLFYAYFMEAAEVFQSLQQRLWIATDKFSVENRVSIIKNAFFSFKDNLQYDNASGSKKIIDIATHPLLLEDMFKGWAPFS